MPFTLPVPCGRLPHSRAALPASIQSLLDGGQVLAFGIDSVGIDRNFFHHISNVRVAVPDTPGWNGSGCTWLENPTDIARRSVSIPGLLEACFTLSQQAHFLLPVADLFAAWELYAPRMGRDEPHHFTTTVLRSGLTVGVMDPHGALDMELTELLDALEEGDEPEEFPTGTFLTLILDHTDHASHHAAFAQAEATALLLREWMRANPQWTAPFAQHPGLPLVAPGIAEIRAALQRP